MKKITLSILGGGVAIIFLIAIVGFLKFNFTNGGDKIPEVNTPVGGASPRDTSYIIDGELMLFTDGMAEREITPDSASKDKFAIFGEPTMGDLDGDGDVDAVMYLTRDSGGSGTFFYVVVAVNERGTYKGTNAMFLGDRIAPQNINMDGGNAVANFVVRNTGEPFTVPPSVGKSVWLHLDPRTLTIGELVKNFEGEADPLRMTLYMKKWAWVRTEYADGTSIAPKKANVFSLAFKKDDTVSVATDCNSMGGKYILKGSSLSFGSMMSTMMFCEGSQESEFSGMLNTVSAYHFTSKGELYLELTQSKGSVILQ
ncbi:MAG: hypothetical protein A2Z88_02230 [Omnitrophica WOR_2 bacterium GWA2_47_8]|nr:MAG: hypothetical protein A2Z88_02230 [Omnitrophica WOR_2 bacterium GWA2_47_8]